MMETEREQASNLHGYTDRWGERERESSRTTLYRDKNTFQEPKELNN